MLKDKIKQEQDKLSKMNTKAKVSYIWDYYKVPIIVIIAVTAIIISLVSTIYTNSQKETILEAAVFDNIGNGDMDDKLLEGFREYAKLESKNQIVNLDSTYVIDDSGQGNPQQVMMSRQKFMAVTAAGEIDLTISKESVVKEYANLGAYEDLKNLLPEDMWQQIEDKAVYMENNNGEEVLVGIRLTDTKAASYFTLEDPIACIVVSSKRQDNAVLFIQYLLSL